MLAGCRLHFTQSSTVPKYSVTGALIDTDVLAKSASSAAFWPLVHMLLPF